MIVELNERSREIFRRVVEAFVETGEPVGSRTISRRLGVQLSPAKAAALQDVNNALEAVQQAQRDGNFADYGNALQKLDDAMNKYRDTK